jgi:hypothetical protein
MSPNSERNNHELYREAWIALSNIEEKRIKLDLIKNEISQEKYKDFKNECETLIAELTPALKNYKGNCEEDLVIIKKEIDDLLLEQNKMQIKLNDNEILNENSLIEESEYYKERKLIEFEQNQIADKLAEIRESYESIERILKYPDPQKEAIYKSEKAENILAEKKAQEQAEKAAFELEEKRKYDFNYQLKKVEEEVKLKAVKKFNLYKEKMEVENKKLRRKLNDNQNNIDKISKEISKKKKENEELKIECELFEKKIGALKGQITKIYSDALERKYPCPDTECPGHIGLEGYCSRCNFSYEEASHNYETKGKTQQIENKIRKYNIVINLNLMILLFVILLGLLSNSEPLIFGSAYFIPTLIIFFIKKTKLKVSLHDINDYQYLKKTKENDEKDKYVDEIDKLKTDLNALKAA